MDAKIQKEKIYLTLGREEIMIHVPFSVVIEEIQPRLRNARFYPVRLTIREEQVLNAVLAGKSNKQIASEMHVTERTVKFHVSSLLLKNKAGSRQQLLGIYANAEGER